MKSHFIVVFHMFNYWGMIRKQRIAKNPPLTALQHYCHRAVTIAGAKKTRGRYAGGSFLCPFRTEGNQAIAFTLLVRRAYLRETVFLWSTPLATPRAISG